MDPPEDVIRFKMGNLLTTLIIIGFRNWRHIVKTVKLNRDSLIKLE